MIGIDVLLGGVTGLLGNAITAFTNYKSTKMDNEHKEKMVELETKAMQEEAKMQIAIKQTEIAGAIELADTNAYTESIKSANVSTFSEKWVDRLFSIEGKCRYLSIPIALFLSVLFGFVEFLKGFMRPGLTAYMVGMSTVITYMAWDIIQKQGLATMTADQAINIYNETTSIIIYLTVSCVTWWFGDRTMSKFLTDLKSNKKK